MDWSVRNLAEIRIARKRMKRSLMISGSALPAELFELRDIEELSFWGKMEAVPDRVSELPKLHTLRFYDDVDADFFKYRKLNLTLPWSTYEKHRRKIDPRRVTGIILDNEAKLPTELYELPNLEYLHADRKLPLGPVERLSGVQSLYLAKGFDPRILRLRNLKELDVDEVEGDVPDLIAGLPNLKKLGLGCAFKSPRDGLPSWLCRPHRLERLSLSQFRLQEHITALHLGPDLRDLDLRDADLDCVPPSIRDLEYLSELNLSSNPIHTLPDWIGDLKHLAILWLAHCELASVPDSVVQLKRLQALSLHSNPIAAIPPDFGELTEIDTLVLGANHLDRVPAEIFDLPNLISLDLSCRRRAKRERKGAITEIPADILRLEQLVELDVEGQPITSPPAEVVAKGLPAIRDYYRQIQDVGLDYLCEAKLLVLGEPGAGKTTLTRKLERADYELRDDQPSTEGIDVLKWGFPFELLVDEDGRMHRLKLDFGVHLWDFGGQEIYHATHQFFLTKRSLYVLVADSRAEDTDFNYWLNVVELLSEGSPLLIVQNEKQDRRRELDEAKLRGRFANLREVLRTNLATGRGLKELTRTVCRELEGLPHIGTPLPKTWKRVREALKRDERNHIPLEAFFDICQNAGFTREDDKLQLSGFLHDLGICLHFQDDPLLRRTVILKPEWGTDAVYRVLDDPGVQEHHGRFDRKQLTQIWSDAKHATMRDELLQLMTRFGLCYPLPNSESFIAPQLLRATRPEYPWDARDNLIVEFRYEFMPKGILTRFIVVLHGLVGDQSLVWKSGVVLTKDGARAEVIEDYSQRVISVRVAGPNRKDLLTIVDWELERIHASFRSLKYIKQIPCNCAQCSAQERPHFYDFEIIRQFTRDRQPQIQCQKSYRMVDVQALIDNVFTVTRSSPRAGVEHISGDASVADRIPVPATAPRKELFVSYAWEAESEKVVDDIAAAIRDRDVSLLREKNELRYKDPIQGFMQRLGKGKCVAVVVSRKFLQSHHCMFELVEVAAAGNFADRIFPIILDDAQIFDAKSRLGYIKYWEAKISELDEEMKTVGQDNLQGIREEIDLYVQIRATMAKLMQILASMNTLSPTEHRRSGFAAFFDKIQAKLAE